MQLPVVLCAGEICLECLVVVKERIEDLVEFPIKDTCAHIDSPECAFVLSFVNIKFHITRPQIHFSILSRHLV